MNLNVSLANIEFDHPVFNASGPLCTTKEELLALASSNSSAILSKSCTLEKRDGNPKPRYKEFDLGSINSMGLPNLGYEFYLEELESLQEFQKPLIASVSGMSQSENAHMLRAFDKCNWLDAVELNLSCPNVIGKPQVGYDFQESKERMREARALYRGVLGVKLPPYFDFAHFLEMAEVLNQSGVNFITCINSPGNGLVIDADSESTLIRPKDGFGGIGGKLIKPFGLSNVRKFRELLNPEIQIIGVGGITSGTDVFEYLLAGADLVQVGTAFMQEGSGIFKRLASELQELMKSKNYSEISQFQNQLKTASPVEAGY